MKEVVSLAALLLGSQVVVLNMGLNGVLLSFTLTGQVEE